jgi:hypothetical protein
MKKVNFLFAGLYTLLLSMNVHAQSKTGADYFAGKWSVLVKGTPNGDAKMLFVLDKKDTGLTGIVQDSTGTKMTDITKIELADTTVTIYFTTQGYDVNLVMNKKDDDHTTGSLMSMFDADGERIKMTK